MAYLPPPTSRSPHLLFLFPQEVVQSILDFFLADTLYHSDKHIYRTLSCRVVSFQHVVRTTEGIRGFCRSWADASRSLVFRGKSMRDNLVLMLPRLLSEKDINTFPLLRDCMVELCHPYWLREIYALQLELAQTTHSLEYVSAVKWEPDNTMEVMRGAVDSTGYSRIATEIVRAFADECIAAGLKITDLNGERPNGGEVGDSESLKEDGLQAMKNFFFKETLALWYYNAHLVRQILGAFPLLEYLELPDFLHVPLLSNVKYFFPQCSDRSPFAPVSLTPPQMLQSLGITYREGGRRYIDIMASVKTVTVLSGHYNPILALFCERFQRIPPVLHPLLIYNRWSYPFQCEVGFDVINMLAEQVSKAVSNIPERRMPTLFRPDILRDVMKEPYD
jgi:hypothetical protein